MEIESSIPKRLKRQHFFNQSCSLLSWEISGGRGGWQNICVKTWYLMESRVQHTQTTVPDSRNLFSLHGKKSLSPVLSLWRINWPREALLFLAHIRPGYSEGRVGEFAPGLRLCFIKILPETVSYCQG